ncbi:MAG: response regulator transcription factor [Anaerolineales bacterium]|nr:response regulator transcription factor [Anaerolineales bacterium]
MDSVVVRHSPILWIEGRWSGNQDFVSLLRKKGFLIETASTGKQAIDMARGNQYDLLIVNAASMRTSGARIVRSVHELYPDLPIILICGPDRTAKGVEDIVGILLVMDFTTRKLVNRIMKLLPGDEKRMIHQGQIVVDPDRSLVSCNGQRTTLTPRLMSLLMLFIEHAGEVITRETLFKNVWKTSYTGDTRTLDVHISWLRQAIEVDPRNPEILLTIRGVGYKLNA